MYVTRMKRPKSSPTPSLGGRKAVTSDPRSDILSGLSPRGSRLPKSTNGLFSLFCTVESRNEPFGKKCIQIISVFQWFSTRNAFPALLLGCGQISRRLSSVPPFVQRLCESSLSEIFRAKHIGSAIGNNDRVCDTYETAKRLTDP